jgi:recombination protein RecA
MTPDEVNAQRRDLVKVMKKKFKGVDGLFVNVLNTPRNIEVIPTKSLVFNALIGIGGIPRGALTEVFGTESSGKTTMAIELCIEAQRQNPHACCLYVDYENALVPEYAMSLGLDMDENRFLWSQPESFEQGRDLILALVEQGSVDLVVIDSGTAMTPQAIFDAETQRLGLQAQLMGTFLGSLVKKITKGRKPAVLLINQMRNRIDLKNTYNNKLDSTASQAVRFYSHIRVALQISKRENDNPSEFGGVKKAYTRNRVKIHVEKNRFRPPHLQGILTIEYGKGTNNIASIAEMAIDLLPIRSGAWIKYEGSTPETTVSCHGQENFVDTLTQNAALYEELRDKVLEVLKTKISSTEKARSPKIENTAPPIELSLDEE